MAGHGAGIAGKVAKAVFQFIYCCALFAKHRRRIGMGRIHFFSNRIEYESWLLGFVRIRIEFESRNGFEIRVFQPLFGEIPSKKWIFFLSALVFWLSPLSRSSCSHRTVPKVEECHFNTYNLGQLGHFYLILSPIFKI